MWTIFDHPRDFPRHVVVRPQIIVPGDVLPGPFACLCDTLDEAREVCMAQPNVSGWFDRDPADDPCIVETWM